MGAGLAYNPRAFAGTVFWLADVIGFAAVRGKGRSRGIGFSVEARIVAVQLVGVALGAGVLLALLDSTLLASFLSGGACGVLPNAWMAWRIRHRSGQPPVREAQRALLAGFEKLALTTMLLALAILRLKDIHAPAFFVGFIVALATHHAALVFATRDGREA